MSRTTLETLVGSEWFRRAIMVPRDYPEQELTDVPLIAVVYTDKGWSWAGDPNGTHWEFWVLGKKVTWDDLTDNQRLQVRTAPAWEGRVRDYWVDLGYEDELYYTLEALECL